MQQIRFNQVYLQEALNHLHQQQFLLTFNILHHKILQKIDFFLELCYFGGLKGIHSRIRWENDKFKS